MTDDQPPPADPAERRRRAEEAVAKAARARGARRPSALDAARLAHELEVHQIELEMQTDELQRALARTAAAREELAEFFTFAPATYLTLDREGAIRTVNSAGERLMGVDRQALVGRHFAPFVRDEDRRRFGELLDGVFAQAAPAGCELTLAPPARPPVFVRIECASRLGGRECGVVIVDLTASRDAAERLRASEAMLQLAAESGDIGLWAWRADTGAIELNALLRTYLKPLPADAPVSLATILDAIHPDDRGAAEAALRAAFATQTPLRHEFRAVLPDGTVRWMAVRANVDHDADGRSTGMMGAALDLTERRSVDEALRESGRRYHLLFDTNPQVMWVVDAENLRFLAVNDEMVRHYGWSREQLLAMTLADIHPPEEWPGVRDRIREGVESGRFEPRIRRHRRRDGTEMLVEARGSVITLDGHRAVLVNAVDVTERERARERVQTLSRAVEQSPAAIVVTDVSGAIEYVNPSFTKATGYAADELRGQTPRVLKSGTSPPGFYEELWRTITAGGTWQATLQNRRKDGTLYWASASISPVFDVDGRITHYVGVQEDITARRLLEDEFRQAQKMEAIGLLAGGVAHDFNNELTVISGYAELALLRMPEGDSRRSWLEQVAKAAARAAALTQRLLVFSHRQPLRPTILRVNDVVRGMEKLLARLVREDVVVRTQLAEGLPPVLADAVGIEQALMNLCANSRDAMPDGGTITISTGLVDLDDTYARTHPGAHPGRFLSLDVTDTGVGMTDEVRVHVFEPFFTTKPLGKGTGLGLTMVYGFVRQSGGYVECLSAPGSGATFRLLLPAVATEPPRAPAPMTSAQAAGDETILVVDDEPDVAAIARDALEGAGYTVIAADSPEVALSHCETHVGPIHLLVTDVTMPRMNGPRVAALVRAARPGTPVLFVSGYTADLVAKGGVLDLGVAFLSKPYTPVELCARVRGLLDATRADAASRSAAPAPPGAL